MKKNIKQALIAFTIFSIFSCSKEDNENEIVDSTEESMVIIYHGTNLLTTNEDDMKIIAQLSEKEELNVVYDLLEEGDIHFFDDDEDYYGFLASKNPSLEKEIWQSFENDQIENYTNVSSEKSSKSECWTGGLQSSFNCDFKFRVALYEHTNRQGSKVYMGVGDLSYVGGSWNDEISSIQIEGGTLLDPIVDGSQRARLTIYEHSNYSGKRQRFHVHSEGIYLNDYVSSTTDKVFNMTSYTMIWRLFKSNTSWNDQVSSLKLKDCGHIGLGTCL